VPRKWQVAVFAVLAVVLLGWAVVSAIRGNTYITVMDAVLGLNCVFTVYRLSRGRRSAPVRGLPIRAPERPPDPPPVPETVRARRERRERRVSEPDGRRRRRQ
jgi:hypothetical protein